MRIAVVLTVLAAACHGAPPGLGDPEPRADGAIADDAGPGDDGAVRDGMPGTDPDAGLDAGPGADAGPDRDAGIDAGIDPPLDAPSPPQTDDLVTTGLCVDNACTAIQPDAIAFEPRWHLWSDGASKRRWIKLPAGAVIDTANMDYWQFPVGTKLWKEFTRNGTRVETRYLVRTGPRPGDWLFMGYEWNAAQSHAVARPNGKQNVNGTPHDIPSQTTCLGCHANNTTPVLGFGAFQLDYRASAGFLDLDGAIAAGWLSQPPPGAASPHLPLPGNATDQAALGYCHANCGHCHNSDSQLTNRPMLRIEGANVDTMARTRLYQSTVNVVARTSPFDGASILAKPGDPDDSVMIKRTTTNDVPRRMPALGIETVDPAGQAILRAWITALP